MKQKKVINDNLKPEHKNTTTRTMMGPTTDTENQEPTIWSR